MAEIPALGDLWPGPALEQKPRCRQESGAGGTGSVGLCSVARDMRFRGSW